jgi:hypothetical protein
LSAEPARVSLKINDLRHRSAGGAGWRWCVLVLRLVLGQSRVGSADQDRPAHADTRQAGALDWLGLDVPLTISHAKPALCLTFWRARISGNPKALTV